MSYSGPPQAGSTSTAASGYQNRWAQQQNKWPADGSGAAAEGSGPAVWEEPTPQPPTSNAANNTPQRPTSQDPSSKRLILIGLLSNSNPGPFKIPPSADLSGEDEIRNERRDLEERRGAERSGAACDDMMSGVSYIFVE
eukprot:GHVU01229269.1.p1 GENE.GHVU01229269.1~~GHVU01229269.1.p1  ORF type:complete len:139 (+),score=22.14 GHVU01229269.1:160-576(+)